MTDTDWSNATNTNTNDALMRKLNMLEAVACLARETVDPESFGITPEIGRYSLARTSWTERVSSWFRGNQP